MAFKGPPDQVASNMVLTYSSIKSVFVSFPLMLFEIFLLICQRVIFKECRVLFSFLVQETITRVTYNAYD